MQRSPITWYQFAILIGLALTTYAVIQGAIPIGDCGSGFAKSSTFTNDACDAAIYARRGSVYPGLGAGVLLILIGGCGFYSASIIKPDSAAPTA